MKQLCKANLEALTQVEEMITGLQPNPTDIAGSVGSAGTDAPLEHKKNLPNVYADSGIGRHVRHVLDHYAVFRQGLDTGHVDYNQRTRNSEVEHSVTLALSLVTELKRWLVNCTELHSCPLEVVSEVSTLEIINVAIDSNVERELHYLAYHTIHHVAYCALLAKQQGKALNPSVGLAPGTATYQRELAEAG